MASSDARIEANRRNAAQSTGPKTAEGKLASRLNAFRHGMAGGGDVLGPREDGRLLAERAEAFARELGAVGESGRALASRAALLSIRAEKLANDEILAVRAAERQALADFDADRVAAIDALLAAAVRPGADPGEALAGLAGAPDGLAALLRAWRDLLARLGSAEPGAAAEVVVRWLGGDASGGDEEPADLARRAEVEVDRLRTLAGTMGAAARALDADRRDVGRLARLDPAPELRRARRYEAAAERGMFRAIRLIADINRQAGRAGAAPAAVAAPPVSPAGGIAPGVPVPPAGSFGSAHAGQLDVLDPLASFRTAADVALASFRAGVSPGVGSPSTAPGRPRRPDYRQLAGGRR